MTTQEIIAEQLSEIYGFELERVQGSAELIADALLRPEVNFSGKEARKEFLRRQAEAPAPRPAPDDDQFSW